MSSSSIMSSLLFYVLTLITILTATVHTLLFLGRVLKNDALEFYGRFLAGSIALFVCALYGMIASAVLNVVGYGGLGQWTTARAYKWTMLLVTGVWFDIHDGGAPGGGSAGGWLDKTRPAVFVGNHQSELDILSLGHIFPKYCSVSAKASLKYMPLLGWFSTCHGISLRLPRPWTYR
jgi:lysophosphatidate acyltransferase